MHVAFNQFYSQMGWDASGEKERGIGYQDNQSLIPDNDTKVDHEHPSFDE
jgi:hypothetical protein